MDVDSGKEKDATGNDKERVGAAATAGEGASKTVDYGAEKKNETGSAGAAVAACADATEPKKSAQPTTGTHAKSVSFSESKNISFSGASANNGVGDGRPSPRPPPPEGDRRAIFQRQMMLQRQEAVHHFDLATGQSTRRRQTVVQLSSTPITPGEDRRGFFARMFGGKKGGPDNRGGADCPSSSATLVDNDGRYKRYRLKSTGEGNNMFDFMETGFFSERLIDYLRWTFKTSFAMLTVANFVMFEVFVLIWAGLLCWYTWARPHCIGSWGFNMAENFVDIYQLSWTTFSTVGYGLVAPNPLGSAKGEPCYGMEFLTSLEAFIGVLFAGFVASILFAKVARVQSIAQVEFSFPMCLRYGPGVLEGKRVGGAGDDSSESDSLSADGDLASVPCPCPILEFRIVNQLSHQVGGEIVNASVNVVATTLAAMSADEDAAFRARQKQQQLEQQAKGNIVKKLVASDATKLITPMTHSAQALAESTGAALFEARQRTKEASGTIFQKINHMIVSTGHSRNPFSEGENADAVRDEEDGQQHQGKKHEGQGGISSSLLEAEIENEVQQRMENQMKEKQAQGGVTLIEATRTAVAVDEGNNQLAPRRIFHKLEMETDTHAFFKRFWIIRHRLDCDSPLLSDRTKRKIEENGGYWPKELMTHRAVRKCVHFHEIIVSFSGTANVSGSSVYAQAIYDFGRVNVGYSFASVLAKDKRGKLIVDTSLLNDIHEQRGGGAEPLRNAIFQDRTAAEYAAGVAHLATTTANAAAATANATDVPSTDGAAANPAPGKEVRNRMSVVMKKGRWTMLEEQDDQEDEGNHERAIKQLKDDQAVAKKNYEASRNDPPEQPKEGGQVQQERPKNAEQEKQQNPEEEGKELEKEGPEETEKAVGQVKDVPSAATSEISLKGGETEQPGQPLDQEKDDTKGEEKRGSASKADAPAEDTAIEDLDKDSDDSESTAELQRQFYQQQRQIQALRGSLM